jgi:hypothetical protein
MRILEGAEGGEEAVQRLLESSFDKQKKKYPFNPIKVFSTANCIAAIDSNCSTR